MTFARDTLRSAAAAGRGVFVGRAGELAVLAAAAAAARRGQPGVVLVEGDAGGGKSTLLTRFASGLAGAAVLRAGGDEAELLLPYGIVGQLVASARGAGGGPPGLLAAELSGGVDPLAVGADLVGWLGQFPAMVLVVIDDLQWADGPSARALLFALRRLQADPVLVVVSARPGELPRLGEGWLRFLAGDYRQAGSAWAAWRRRRWWRWAGRWGPGSCRAGWSAVCWRRLAVTRCIAGRCWKRPGRRAVTWAAGRFRCRGRWPGQCWRG